jgi:glycosyltransferase involved in cell wall biosynthesis
MKTLTIIVPFYNEERTLPLLLSQISALPRDGSDDSSLLILKSALTDFPFHYEILTKTNGGKTSAISFASKKVCTTHAIILDADLELETTDVLKLWQIVIDGNSDFVFGYRVFLSHSSYTWRYSRGNQFISNFFGFLFNELITDIMCGYKLVPTNFLNSINFSSARFGFEVEIPMRMWQIRERAYEVSVSYKARSRMEGKSISTKDAIIILLLMFRFRFTKRRVVK